MRFLRPLQGALLATAVMAVATAPVYAQGRLSLAERVAQLEAQAASGQGSQSTVELLNRISELQTEVQSLRGLVEQQAFELENLSKRNRDQYVDLDGRIARVESGGEAPQRPAPAGGSAVTSVNGSAGGGFVDLPEDPRVASVDDPAFAGGDRAVTATTDEDLMLLEPEVRAPVDGGVSTRGVDSTGSAAMEVVGGSPEDERALYDNAFDALKDGRYAEAARRFQGFLNQYPRGDYAPNAMYWLGESYYVTQNYQVALDSFQRLLREFPSSAKAPDALLKLGYCHYELRQWDDAESTLNRVIQQYPDTTVARLAQGRLRALRLENRR